MAEVVARMRELERSPGVLSVSLAHGFPWGDTAVMFHCFLRLPVIKRQIAQQGVDSRVFLPNELPTHRFLRQVVALQAVESGNHRPTHCRVVVGNKFIERLFNLFV